MKAPFYLFVALVPVILAGCGSKDAKTSPEEVKAFAPGMNNLSPEAKAAKEKNESNLRAAQARAAQSASRPGVAR